MSKCTGEMMLNSTAIEGLKRFLQHAEALNPSNNPHRENGFAKEFQEIKDFSSKLKKDPEYSTKHGEKEVNRLKNRYKDILPYDYSRIILPENNGIEGSDYINGNYIKGPSNEIVYLTAQGPLPSTVDDFWRMIISHKIQVIVMACKEYELGKLKCKRYWPESMEEIMEYGGCKISLISQENLGDGFIIRTLSAKSTKEELKVTQFHYTAWPDHDVPRSATPLIELTMSFRAFVGSDNKVPVLVHCSAGCGRTGTICALDYARSLIQMGRTENFSVFEIVKSLRKQRIAMVQTKGQYELVYKAVKELVNDELKKHRPKGPTSHYVNVEINKEYKEGSTYENVDFIRSIQRLHQEERNASRKPISVRQAPPLSNMAAVLAPRKGMVLAEKTNLLTSKKIDNQTDQQKEILNQLSKEKVKDNIVQTSARPFQNERPSSGYENVLPLSLAPKPPVAQKPQNYVNVVIGSSQKIDEDYVNVITTKVVPVPSDMNESAATNTVPILDPLVNSSSSYMQKLKPASLITKPDVCNKKQSECESPKHQSQFSAESDYVISPMSETSAAPRPQVNQGKLIDVEEPEVKPALVAYKPNLLKQSSFDKEYTPKQFAQQASNSTSHTVVCKEVKTSKPRGQYSLIGAVKSPESPNRNITNPFVKEPKAKGSSSQKMTEAVESDGSSLKTKKLIATSRRLSDGSNAAGTKNSQEDFFGTYSVVMEKTITKEKESASKPEPISSECEQPHIKQRTSDDKYLSNGSRQSGVPIQKAYSTENVNSPMSREQSIQKSDLSDFALVSTPYRPKDSGSSSPALNSNVDNKGSVKTAKPSAALKRSNSGIVASASLSSGDGDGLYATVGVRTKKRLPLSTETWSNGHLPAIDSRGLKHSPNSTSSLRSATSLSSNDSSEEIPPVPVKTTNAFVSPGEEDVYEAVQRSSGKSSTMDRFKAKARNMITYGPQVPKISIGKKNLSPANTPRSASPVLGERATSYTGCQLGYGNRATKPSGPRSCPGHWPSFS